MTIIGLFYLLLIMGWILLILVLKCKRARAKRLAEEQGKSLKKRFCNAVRRKYHTYCATTEVIRKMLLLIKPTLVQ